MANQFTRMPHAAPGGRQLSGAAPPTVRKRSWHQALRSSPSSWTYAGGQPYAGTDSNYPHERNSWPPPGA